VLKFIYIGKGEGVGGCWGGWGGWGGKGGGGGCRQASKLNSFPRNNSAPRSKILGVNSV